MTYYMEPAETFKMLPRGEYFQKKWLNKDPTYNPEVIVRIIQDIWPKMKNLSIWCDPCHIFRLWRLVQLYQYTMSKQTDISPSWVDIVAPPPHKKVYPKKNKSYLSTFVHFDQSVLKRLEHMYSTPEIAFQNREEIWVNLSGGNRRIGNIDEMVLADEIFKHYGSNHPITAEFRRLAINVGDIYVIHILDGKLCVPTIIIDMNEGYDDPEIVDLNMKFYSDLGCLKSQLDTL